MNSPIPGTIRDSLQGQTLDDFDPSQFSTAGGMLFYSMDSAPNQVDIHSLVSTYQSVHLPSFGQFIPQSSGITADSITDSGPTTLVSPTGNQVIKVEAVTFVNGGVGGVTFTLTLNDGLKSMTIASEEVSASTTKPIVLQTPLVIDSNATITCTANGDLDVSLYTYKVVQ